MNSSLPLFVFELPNLQSTQAEILHSKMALTLKVGWWAEKVGVGVFYI